MASKSELADLSEQCLVVRFKVVYVVLTEQLDKEPPSRLIDTEHPCETKAR